MFAILKNTFFKYITLGQLITMTKNQQTPNWHKEYTSFKIVFIIERILLYVVMVTLYHGLINYINTKAKCRHLKKFTCKGTLLHMFIRVYRLVKQSVMLEFLTKFCELCPNNLLSSVSTKTYRPVKSTNTTCHVRLSNPLWRKAYPIAAQKIEEKMRRNMPSYRIRIYFHVSYPDSVSACVISSTSRLDLIHKSMTYC